MLIQFEASRTMLNKFSFVLITLLLTSMINAQSRVSKGQVVDSQSGIGLEYALTSIYKPDSTVLTSTTTDSLGYYSFDIQLPKGSYLEVQYLGYISYKSALANIMTSNGINLIKLSPSSNLLNEVTIKGQQLSVYQKLDRQQFKASQFGNAIGGTAYELVKNLPSISTNAEGDISMRGSKGFILMMNGKVMNVDPKLILSQLSAASIEDIEVITTPSAAYDPDGNGGIIHIKSKSIKTDGSSLSIGANVGFPNLQNYGNKAGQQRYGGDITYNLRKGKLDLLLGADYLRDDRSGQRIGYVNTLNNNILTEFPSYGERSTDQTNYSLRASANLQLTQSQALNLSIYAGSKDQARTADILYEGQQRIATNGNITPIAAYESYVASNKLYTNGTVINKVTVYNENLRVRNGDFLLAGLDYTFKLPKGWNIKAATLYETAQLGGPTDNYNYSSKTKEKIVQYQYNDNNNPLTGYRLQLDGDKTIGKVKVEAGYQYRNTSHPGDFLYLDRNLITNVLEIVPNFTNQLGLTQSINSLYAQLSANYGGLSFSGGLRLEQMNRVVTLETPKATYKLDTINLFPNLAMSYKVSSGITLRGGYSKRIQRNTTSMLTPFPEREHSETLEQGDAQLQPEFVNNFDVGMQLIKGNSNMFATLYSRSISNVINRVNSVYNDTILNRIYTNAGTARIYGIEFGGNITITKNVKWYIGSNVFNYGIKGNLLGEQIDVSRNQYSFNTTVDFPLPAKVDAQFGLNYLSKRITAQGIDSRFYLPSLTLSKRINDRLSFVVNWTNIDMGLLQSNEQAIDTWREDFYTTTNYVYEVDIVKFAANYKINQLSKSNKFKASEFGAQEF